MGRKQKPGALPPVQCHFCPKIVNGDIGLSDHLFVVHKLGIGNKRFWGNVRKGMRVEKNTCQPEPNR